MKVKYQVITYNSLWRKQMNPQLAGYTGGIFEREVLGQCRVRSQGYLTFQAAMEEVMRNQPHAPHDPPGEIGRFRSVVARKMKVAGFNPDHLHLFTAVGSTLDQFHGVDGFFVFHGITVTVDTTINDSKDEESSKALVLVTGEDAVDGFERPAERVVGLFRYAQARGMKGVIRK